MFSILVKKNADHNCLSYGALPLGVPLPSPAAAPVASLPIRGLQIGAQHKQCGYGCYTAVPATTCNNINPSVILKRGVVFYFRRGPSLGLDIISNLFFCEFIGTQSSLRILKRTIMHTVFQYLSNS
uniref:Uncharacterized protein n=1 Tax=Aegilops tauschii subsp. strangulata TaxID=200361 RepID=A0A453M4G7_AEGTS